MLENSFIKNHHDQDLKQENLMESYSSILSPEDYNHLMTEEHLYISTSDRFIVKTIESLTKEKSLNVVELGCGPGRVTTLLANVPNIKLTAIDIDPVFINFAKEKLSTSNIEFMVDNIINFKLNKRADVVFSQGFHHHISKGEQNFKYLTNVYNQLSQGGVYILSDEFVPNYINDKDRNTKLVIWYAHVIAHAIRHGYEFLAREEAKTLLDDLQEGAEEQGIKSEDQIQLVLQAVSEIDKFAKQNDMDKATALAENFLIQLKVLFSLKLNGDITMDLSRHDYKICDRIFREEVEKVGFSVELCRSFGPIENIGGMSVYILRK